MSKDFIIKKCKSCGAYVKIIKDCTCENCGIKCCGEEMAELIPNSVDAAIEKHVPTYEIEDGKLFVKVNHVMEEEHYIEWISIVSEDKEMMNHYFLLNIYLVLQFMHIVINILFGKLM